MGKLLTSLMSSPGTLMSLILVNKQLHCCVYVMWVYLLCLRPDSSHERVLSGQD